MGPLTIAVTGLNATDNPAPGVPVIRALRCGAKRPIRILGLSYDPLDPGNFMDEIADAVYLLPYPSQGADVLADRLASIHERDPIDVLVPTLDAELPAVLKIEKELRRMGIRALVPTEEQLRLRSKARLHELEERFQIRTPRSVALTDSRTIQLLDKELKFPVMIKGQFYDAQIAYSPMEAESCFQRLRAKWGVPVIAQEFVSGEEYDVVALGDGAGGLVGAVAMRKMQLTDKGKAWGGITVADPSLMRFVANAVSALSWRGPCEIEVMKASSTSEMYLIEINPRFPAWVYLAVGAGCNLPWAAVELALGEKVEFLPPAPAGVMFLRHSFDQICTLADYEALTTSGELVRRKGLK